ncbi:MAG: DinB family protein [Dehalococcoidia bacterium]
MTDFNSDKAELLNEMQQSRVQLNKVVGKLSADDLSSARRGSWPVSKILDHVLHSERLYAQLISVFSGVGTTAEPSANPSTSADALAALEATRKAVLAGVGHVKEDDFYRLQSIGHEEYSVLSILENVAAHDREHAEQIHKTISE